MSNGIEFNRKWAMPNSATFEIEPIGNLVQRELDNSNGTWIDPFAGDSSMADFTNDLNPEKDTDYTLPATEFLDKFNRCEIDGGVLFDPPYSPRQIKEVYDSVGMEVTQETTQATFWTECKEEIARVCDQGATVITCGWNSGGIGKTWFNIRKILLVAHGGWHNDTIVTVEDAEQASIAEYTEL